MSDIIMDAQHHAWLVDRLKEGPVDVTFTKKDGTLRKMHCTLNDGIAVPYVKKTDRVRKERSVDIQPVWDIDNNDWRSFDVTTLQHIVIGEQQFDVLHEDTSIEV